ncbi:MAG: hypothetical protein SWX82_35000 [Cyanobacteriota bacterium]|nr:hypothetical protein [Cyanobacteriota bacterium]
MDNSYGSAEERSLCDCNCYYWTIVMALLLSAIRQLCGSLIALRLQFLLLDNSYQNNMGRATPPFKAIGFLELFSNPLLPLHRRG